MNTQLLHLAQTVGELARKKNIKLATAESCTGGLIAAALTYWPGASIWFERGVVAYTNRAKEQLLAVSGEILAADGAVSETAVAAMCAEAGGDAALAVTGIAGPEGGSTKKPVGMVCFGWRWGDETCAATKYFAGNREAVRTAAAIHALSIMAERLQEINHFDD